VQGFVETKSNVFLTRRRKIFTSPLFFLQIICYKRTPNAIFFSKKRLFNIPEKYFLQKIWAKYPPENRTETIIRASKKK